MPREKIPKSRVKNARTEPYRKPVKDTEAIDSAVYQSETEDKDKHVGNAWPKADAAPAAGAKAASKKREGPSTKKASADLPDSYLDIALEEKEGEVPCYEDAAAVRRKLNALLDKKAKIPGSTKTFNKTSLSKEMCDIAQSHHPIKTTAGVRNDGPSVRALTAFLKKSGSMGGGECQVLQLSESLQHMPSMMTPPLHRLEGLEHALPLANARNTFVRRYGFAYRARN
ncbi:uncharacterized protein EKO05_0010862 [Ascochyta rabiei]|uniref:uncharacterized protein n=1 Tax=Didymella rabiei TaxID=5454 RepID=UPI0019011011|nr:uncharacterized protein EKO05_0010862 [Ascochyta rabiei]UPX20634.1 hypothetical protein EKO05_0010862 [Ascochyta rabiei]